MRRFTERAIDTVRRRAVPDRRARRRPAARRGLRRAGCASAHDKVILVANKCEGRAGQNGLAEAHALGLGEPIPVSAEHGEGLSDLHEAMARHHRADAGRRGRRRSRRRGERQDAEAAAAAAKRPLMLAIVGRPNVGKSTLLNRLVGEERVLTGPEAGITRDSIRVEWQWRGRKIRLIDTAGMRRRSRIDRQPRSRPRSPTRSTPSVSPTWSWSCSMPPTWPRSRTSPWPAG